MSENPMDACGCEEHPEKYFGNIPDSIMGNIPDSIMGFTFLYFRDKLIGHLAWFCCSSLSAEPDKFL